MPCYKLEEVFGVSKDPVQSYVERSEVDGLFLKALRTDNQIIVYGASKQGKTSLVEKHLPYKENVTVSLTPKFRLIDIYKSILSSLDIELTTDTSTTTGTSTDVSLGAKVRAIFPLMGSAEGSTSFSEKDTKAIAEKRNSIELNLELPNDVVRAYKKSGTSKFIILENFHYLDEETQKQFAFDLRSFQELGLRFIILGVWREKNRLIQFNGDLLDRIFEVPVEPWDIEDFHKVVTKGSSCLNVEFSSELIDVIIQSAFDSIGVVQELLKSVCQSANVEETRLKLLTLNDLAALDKAKAEKVQSYSARHLRALEAIAEGRKTTNQPKSDDPKDMPLYLPYYTVRSILSCKFEEVMKGITRNSLEKKIKEIHHRPDDVRAGDMSNLLYNFAKLQSEKSISPPIFDYDKTTQTIRVIDSTFYFFLKNMDLNIIMAQILDPTKRTQRM
ncbi:hypothetical protein ACTRXD_12940 [Nitrospira sp. T9]|uniref:hypothetical protein n=1 Tax=unclassified Nitrospira TaxID=2652172 RepID=UPI003F96128C